MPKYVPIETAKTTPGMRLVLTAIAGAPWTEAAKAVFHVKRIPYVPVAQMPVETNDALRAWTGHENAPIAVYENEKPRAGWAEILFLVERLAPEPRLIPANPEDRVRMFGLAHELCGEDGLAWNRRYQMISGAMNPGGGAVPKPIGEYLASKYGFSEADAARAPARVAEILATMSRQYRAQQERGRRFLIGESLSALDLYWATFAAIVDPLPPDHCPMPDWLRNAYKVVDPAVTSALDPGLLAHRERIYREYLPLPIDA
jgi:glutathione S-transferase